MAIQVSWDENVPQVLRVKLGSGHSWNELYAVMERLKTEDAQATQKYHIIFTIEGKMPSGNPLPHFRAMYNTMKSLKNVHYIINIVDGGAIFAANLLQVVLKAVGILPNLLFIKSLDKAYEHIRELDEIAA